MFRIIHPFFLELILMPPPLSFFPLQISMFPVAAIVDGWSGGGAGRRRRQGDGVRVGLLVVVAVLTYTVPDFSLLLR